MQQALATRGQAGVLISRPHAARRAGVVCRAATAVKTPEKFIPPWRDCYGELKAKGLRTVSPQEAKELLATGKWVLLDVRRPDQHEEAHPEGAVSVPMYRRLDMSKPDFSKMMKAVAYTFNGVTPIDSNMAFTSEVLAAAPGKKYVMVCEAGGTMRASVNFPQGKPSRSLQAAYKLMDEAGLTADDLVHLERGVYGWYQAQLPMAGTYTPDVGRTPMAADEPEVQTPGQGAGQEPKKKGWFGL